MSTGIPHASVSAIGPLSRGEFLMLLHWFADTNSVPEVLGIKGLSRLTRLSLILGEDLGTRRTIEPFFNYYRTPKGGIVSPEVWTEVLSLREYQILTPLPVDEAMPPEELEERRYLLEHHIPVHERSHYPLPARLERDVLTNKGTFFAAKREDQAIQRSIAIYKTAAELSQLSLSELTARALPLVREPVATR